MLSRSTRFYPCDLTDAQWQVIKHLLPKAKRGGRPRFTCIRQIINAVFFIIRTGSPWRYLPRHFPPWKTVYWYFSQWVKAGIWKNLHDYLVGLLRRKNLKRKFPSICIVDSQTIKASHGKERGYDGFKKLRGRKRQILVDTLGMIHSVKIHGANLPDCSQGHKLYEDLSPRLRRGLRGIYADLGYRGQFVRETNHILGFVPTMPAGRTNFGQGIKKTTKEKKLSQRLRGEIGKRWIVERTFAWFNHYRRLSKDYERNTQNSAATIHIAMSQMILKRIVQSHDH